MTRCVKLVLRDDLWLPVCKTGYSMVAYGELSVRLVFCMVTHGNLYKWTCTSVLCRHIQCEL